MNKKLEPSGWRNWSDWPMIRHAQQQFMAAALADYFHRSGRHRPALHPVGLGGRGLRLEPASGAPAPELRGCAGRLCLIGRIPLSADS